jgi:hypothetical protein
VTGVLNPPPLRLEVGDDLQGALDQPVGTREVTWPGGECPTILSARHGGNHHLKVTRFEILPIFPHEDIHLIIRVPSRIIVHRDDMIPQLLIDPSYGTGSAEKVQHFAGFFARHHGWRWVDCVGGVLGCG